MERVQCRRRDLFLLVVCVLSFFVWIHVHHLGTIEQRRPAVLVHGPAVHAPAEAPKQFDPWAGDEDIANATLGFGKIIAVSTKTSRRRASLLLSGEITGLDITIPDQPTWTDADIASIKSKEKSQVLRASALAWLGHLNALKWFIQSGAETAVILEDDVDWDIHIRTRQIPLLARAFRDLLAQPPAQPVSPSRNHDTLARSQPASAGDYKSYWPPQGGWELLYLGHCGDFFPSKNLTNLQPKVYADASVPAIGGLHVDTQKFMMSLPVPAHHRVLHKSARPLCTFAYAVNRESAKKMLSELSTERENRGTWAWDVRILEACRDMGYKCWSVNPELFHHHDAHASEIQKMNNGVPLFEEKTSFEDLQRERVRGTPNIGCGVRKIAETMGRDPQSIQLVRMAAKLDGMCPMPTQEIDGMRSYLEIEGRKDLPIDGMSGT